jgi:predicted lipase
MKLPHMETMPRLGSARFHQTGSVIENMKYIRMFSVVTNRFLVEFSTMVYSGQIFENYTSNSNFWASFSGVK